MDRVGQIDAMAGTESLAILGIVPEGAAALPEGLRALVLLGPSGPGFWAHVTAAPEFSDGTADPIDRWSQRVIGAMAAAIDGQALFPFGTQPPHPFVSWALATGQAYLAPVPLLVHAQAGLWVSYRGAIGLRAALPARPLPNPCTDCARPCLTACPVGALSGVGYDLAACHAFLDRPAGKGCMSGGCAVRAACPVSQAHGREPAQSAYHMRQFHR